MALTARASNTVRNKNFIIVLMCVGSMAWFAYDGWKGYPTANDACVKILADSPQVASADQEFVRGWKKWVNETAENRQRMDLLVENAKKNVGGLAHWKKVSEINLQRWIVLGLLGATGAAIWWFVHCQRRRAIADDATLSPSPGVVIPWEKITKVDNTRWHSMGIVEITYSDSAGNSAKAKLDDYETERKPLLEILDMLAEKAVNAEFFPTEETAPDAAEPKKS